MTRRWTLAIVLAYWITLPLVAQETPHEALRRIEQALDREIPVGLTRMPVQQGLQTLLEPVEDLLHFDSRIEILLRERTLTVGPGEQTVRQVLDRLRTIDRIHAVPSCGQLVLTNSQGAFSLPRKLPRPGPDATEKVRDIHQFFSGKDQQENRTSLKVNQLTLSQCTELILDLSDLRREVRLSLPSELAKRIVSFQYHNLPVLEALTLLSWQAGGKLQYGRDGLEVVEIHTTH